MQRKQELAHLPKRPPVDIEFQDLSYTVPQGRKGTKLILRSINGTFQSGQLSAILGPSGAGKSTLLNVLAGYKSSSASGSVLVNGEPRNLKAFRKMSRYIMQQDLIQPMLSVGEVMMMAADLKLGETVSRQHKQEAIAEVLSLLRLASSGATTTGRLSGGEKKRLSIALELLNNPPVLFLDEPTTGLDDLSCTQCIMLLKQIAEGGRTVICSIHTPSARLFSVFDKVYVLSAGQCVFQGHGTDVVPFLAQVDLICPTTYNPADFMMEVCCGEYGEYQDRMVSTIDNGRNIYHKNTICSVFEVHDSNKQIELFESYKNAPQMRSRWLRQFWIILNRMWIQMWRDKTYLLLRLVMHILLGLLIGNLYIGMGNDGSKTIFNFGFYFTCIIFFMYVPMMPILVYFPTEVQYLKREHFNKWYRLSSYFCALCVSTLPVQVLFGSLYLTMVYLFSDQPLEVGRIVPFYFICILTGVISESFGLLISSVLNIVNGMFVGPVMTVPFMLLATYGFGEGYSNIPFLIKFMMRFNYLRYSMEGIANVMLKGRARLSCPDTEEICIFTDLDKFVEVMAMDNAVVWVDVVALLVFLVLVRGASYYLLRQRLTPNKAFMALQYIGRFVKANLNLGR